MDIVIFLMPLALSICSACLLRKTMGSIEPLTKEWLKCEAVNKGNFDYARSHELVMARAKIAQFNTTHDTPPDDVISFLHQWKGQVNQYIDDYNDHHQNIDKNHNHTVH
jgi:hypothetical protein